MTTNDEEYFKNQGFALIGLGIVTMLSAIIFLSMMFGISIWQFISTIPMDAIIICISSTIAVYFGIWITNKLTVMLRRA